ncbi:MAG TPA: nucleoside hydrolase [Candidatus Obscuribacterales bacterium]
MDDLVISPSAMLPADGVRPSQFFGGGTFGKLVGAFRRLDAWAMRREVLVCTDCATFDDRAALALLALSPRWRLVGVVSTTVPEKTIEPENKSLSPIVLDDDRVSQCLASLPLKKQPHVVPGAQALSTNADTPDNEAADFIIATAAAHGQRNRLLVVVLGAATDVAIALGKDAELEDKIEVVAAAFDNWPNGGDHNKASHDVAAWQMIMDSSVSVTIASGQTAADSLSMSPRDALTRLRGKARKQVGQKLFSWLKSEQTINEKNDEPQTLTGLLAVAHAFGYTQTTLYRRPTLKDDCNFLHGGSTEPLPCQTCIGEPRIRWIVGVEEKRFWGELVSTISSYGTEPDSASGSENDR